MLALGDWMNRLMDWKRIALVALAFSQAWAGLILPTPADSVNWNKLIAYALFGQNSIFIQGNVRTDVKGFIGSNGDYGAQNGSTTLSGALKIRGNFWDAGGDVYKEDVIVGKSASNQNGGIVFEKTTNVWGTWQLDKNHTYKGAAYTLDAAPAWGGGSYLMGRIGGATPPDA